MLWCYAKDAFAAEQWALVHWPTPACLLALLPPLASSTRRAAWQGVPEPCLQPCLCCSQRGHLHPHPQAGAGAAPAPVG